MARISSQGTVIKIGTDLSLVSTAITLVTNTKPAVITVASTTSIALGSIIIPRDTGYNSLDGQAFAAEAVDTTAKTVTLADSDTTNDTGVTLGASAMADVPKMEELCRSTFTVMGPAGATIDVTTLCDEAHRIVSGLPAIGTWTANGFYDYQDTVLKKARDYYRSGDTIPIMAVFRDKSGLTFMGTINTYDITLGINAAVTTNIGGNVDGIVNLFDPIAGMVVMMGKSGGTEQPVAPAGEAALVQPG